MKRLLISLGIGVAALAPSASASATVHEIVGQWCAGRGELFPPGITGRSNADNFAKPLFANGFASVVPGFDPDGGGPMEPGVLIAFDFDHPASKISSLGFFNEIDRTPDGSPVYLEAFELKSGHGFTNCARLRN